MKNFLDHFWREFAGKLFATIVASHEKGLTVTDQLRTVAGNVTPGRYLTAFLSWVRKMLRTAKSQARPWPAAWK